MASISEQLKTIFDNNNQVIEEMKEAQSTLFMKVRDIEAQNRNIAQVMENVKRMEEESNFEKF